MNRLQSVTVNQSLLLSLQALKSQVSGLQLRARQAEDLTALLLSEKIPPELLPEQVFQRIIKHIDARELERSVQYLGVIQTTLLVLNQIAQRPDCEGEIKNELVEAVKALTLTVKAGENGNRPQTSPRQSGGTPTGIPPTQT